MSKEYNIVLLPISNEREVEVRIAGTIEGTAAWDGNLECDEEDRYLADDECESAERSANTFGEKIEANLKESCSRLLGEGACSAVYEGVELIVGDGSIDITVDAILKCERYADAAGEILTCAIDGFDGGSIVPAEDVA